MNVAFIILVGLILYFCSVIILNLWKDAVKNKIMEMSFIKLKLWGYFLNVGFYIHFLSLAVLLASIIYLFVRCLSFLLWR